MIITKTDFINYTRCPLYYHLIKNSNNKMQVVTERDYFWQEKMEHIKELEANMLGDQKISDEKLEAMLPFYKQVEVEAAKLVQKYFDGDVLFAEKTLDQKCFSFSKEHNKFMCYVDIFNKSEWGENIIEVKATTNKKYTALTGGFRGKKQYSLFSFNREKNCYYLNDYDPDKMPLDVYNNLISKLMDRFSDVGGYVFDLAVQRYFLEGQYKERCESEKLEKIHYYLAVLNSDYTFLGTYQKEKTIYENDLNGNEVICFIDLTSITQKYMMIIDDLLKTLFSDMNNEIIPKVALGPYCGMGKSKECMFFKSHCGKMIPEKNSSLNYLNNGFGFKTSEGKRLKGLELINQGYLNMLDIPEDWIVQKKHQIQRNTIINNKPYKDLSKIKAGLNMLEYPIYHLDFETFPAPLPRFRNEHPYMQSVFEFSLHIEREPGKCDKDRDNYVFLANSFDSDEREELVKNLVKHIDGTKGTLLAQNVSFEKERIRELADIFPQYKDQLMAIYKRGFDLLWLINTNKKMYEDLGFTEERSSLPNFYHRDLSGSFSIKKTLPVFSNLSYKDLEVKNGNEAIVAYANYDNMSKEELIKQQESLRIYCKQDTWAMVVILDALRRLTEK